MSIPDIALAATALLVAAALLGAALVRARASRAHGAPVAAELARRPLLGIVAVAVAAVAVLLGGADPLPLAVLFASAALWFLAPGAHDRVLGRLGVRRGWSVVRFDEVVEWRLTGDHLRVRLFGEWEAVPAPARDQAELRRVLEERAPGRESRFTS